MRVLYVSAEVIAVRLQGADVKYIATSLGLNTSTVYAAKDISSVEALQGKKIAVTGTGTATETAVLYLQQARAQGH